MEEQGILLSILVMTLVVSATSVLTAQSTGGGPSLDQLFSEIRGFALASATSSRADCKAMAKREHGVSRKRLFYVSKENSSEKGQ